MLNSPALFGYSEDTDSEGVRQVVDLKRELTDEQKDLVLGTVLGLLKSVGEKNLEVCIVATRIYKTKEEIRETEADKIIWKKREAPKDVSQKIRSVRDKSSKPISRKKPRY